MQITGEYRIVQDALFQVTCSLRDNLLPGEVRKAVRAKYPYMRLIVDPLRNDPVPHNIGALSPSRLPFPKVKLPPYLFCSCHLFLQILQKYVGRSKVLNVDGGYNCRPWEEDKQQQSQIVEVA